MAPTPEAEELLQQTGLSDYLDLLEFEYAEKKHKPISTSISIIPENVRNDLQNYAETLVKNTAVPYETKKKKLITKALQILSNNNEELITPSVIDSIMAIINAYANPYAYKQVYAIVLANFRAKQTVKSIQRTLNELVEILRTDIGLVLDRGEKIEALLKKTRELARKAISFKKHATKLNQVSRSNNALAMGIIIGIVLGIGIGIAVSILTCGVFAGLGLGTLGITLAIGSGFISGAISCAITIGLSLAISRIYLFCKRLRNKIEEDRAFKRFSSTPARNPEQPSIDSKARTMPSPPTIIAPNAKTPQTHEEPPSPFSQPEKLPVNRREQYDTETSKSKQDTSSFSLSRLFRAPLKNVDVSEGSEGSIISPGPNGSVL